MCASCHDYATFASCHRSAVATATRLRANLAYRCVVSHHLPTTPFSCVSCLVELQTKQKRYAKLPGGILEKGDLRLKRIHFVHPPKSGGTTFGQVVISTACEMNAAFRDSLDWCSNQNQARLLFIVL